MRKELKIIWTHIACLMLAAGLFCLPAAVRAEEGTIDPSKKGSVTVSSQSAEDQSITEGTEFALYFLARQDPASGELHFIAEPDFADAGFDLNNLTTQDVSELLKYAQNNNIEAKTEKANAKGIVRFSNLNQGLYILVPVNIESGSVNALPALVSIPAKNENGNWIYDVHTYPKTEIVKEIDITVRKVWNTGGKTHPDSVTVYLYKGKEKVDTQVLNEKNKWQYTFTGLVEGEDWTIKEADIKGYTATVSKLDKNNVITVTNTPKLIQTGQLKWPIPWLAAGGVLFLGVGVGLFSSKKKNAD